MIQELLAGLQENPPQTEADLEQLLADTGYDLVPVQGVESEADAMGDMAEDSGEAVEEEEVVEEDEAPTDEGPLDAMADMMGGAPQTPGMKMNVLRMKVSKKALDGERKGKGGR